MSAERTEVRSGRRGASEREPPRPERHGLRRAFVALTRRMAERPPAPPDPRTRLPPPVDRSPSQSDLIRFNLL